MRGGRKKRPVYRIVAADSRFSRDGRFLERVGTYNPLENQDQQVTLKEDRIMYWLQNGAQPTDTTRNILSSHGLMLKFELLKKGTSEDQIDEIVNKFKEEKAASLLKKAEHALKAKEAKKAKAVKEEAAASEEAEEEKVESADETVIEDAPVAEEVASDESAPEEKKADA